MFEQKGGRMEIEKERKMDEENFHGVRKKEMMEKKRKKNEREMKTFKAGMGKAKRS